MYILHNNNSGSHVRSLTTPRRHNVRIAAQECSRGLSLLPTQLLCAVQSKDLDIGDPHNVLDIFEHLNIRHGMNRSDPSHRQSVQILLFHNDPQTEQRDRSVPWIHKSMFLHTAHRTRRVLCSQKFTKNNQGSDDFAKVPVCAPHTVVYADCRGHDVDRSRQLPHCKSA